MGHPPFRVPVHAPFPDAILDPALPPALIRAFLHELGANAALTKRVWNRFRVLASYDAIHRMTRAHVLPEVDGLRALRQVLTPGLLVRIPDALAPPTGQPRPPEVRRLETAILEQTTATGTCSTRRRSRHMMQVAQRFKSAPVADFPIETGAL